MRKVLGIMMLLGAMSATSFAAQKVGKVNTIKVMQSYGKTAAGKAALKKVENAVKAESNRLKKQLDVDAKALEKLVTDIQKAGKKPTEAQIKKVEAKQKALAKKAAQKQEQLVKFEAKKMEAISKKLAAKVSSTAKSGGYDLVVQDGGILYGNPAEITDITTKVINSLK